MFEMIYLMRATLAYYITNNTYQHSTRSLVYSNKHSKYIRVNKVIASSVSIFLGTQQYSSFASTVHFALRCTQISLVYAKSRLMEQKTGTILVWLMLYCSVYFAPYVFSGSRQYILFTIISLGKLVVFLWPARHIINSFCTQQINYCLNLESLRNKIVND